MARTCKTMAWLAGGAMAASLSVAAPEARADVLLTGKAGWEVSVGGSVNNFALFATSDGGGPFDANDTFQVRNGLLPAVLGIEAHSPTVGGLDMRARFGFYPHTNNDNGLKNQFGGQIDFREVFFEVSGDFGSALVGKTLALFLGKNIIKDMTILGVGAIGPDNSHVGTGTTTLGRIGYGYVYPNFNSAIRYSSPETYGFTGTVGIYDPSPIRGNDQNAAEDGRQAALYDGTSIPRFEGEVSYAATIGQVSVEAWGNGMWQQAKCEGAEVADFTASATGGCYEGEDEVTAWGLGGGVDLGVTAPGGVAMHLVGTGYWGRGLGTILMLDSDSLGANGARKNYGFYLQATAQFPQGTGLGVSYGGTHASAQGEGDAGIKRLTLLDVMTWHNINDNLRLIAEYGYQEDDNFGGENQETHIFSVGGFFFF